MAEIRANFLKCEESVFEPSGTVPELKNEIERKLEAKEEESSNGHSKKELKTEDGKTERRMWKAAETEH